MFYAQIWHTDSQESETAEFYLTEQKPKRKFGFFAFIFI